MYKTTILFISAIVLLISQNGYANSGCPEPQDIQPRDVRGLEKHFQRGTLKSIDCAISSLPKDVKALRTYLKSSLSLQDASPQNPRALLSDPKAGFLLTFNGHKNQKGYNEIEFIALDSADKPTKWVTGQIIESNGKLKFKKNVAKCASCHGDPIRPIWGNYPSWPNAYGAIDDWLPIPKNPAKDGFRYSDDVEKKRLDDDKINIALKDRTDFVAFRKSARNHPRYSYLEKVSDPANPVFPYSHAYRTRNTADRPNLMIGSLMTIRQAEIIANRIQGNFFYGKFNQTLLYFNNCLDKDTTQAEYKRYFDFLSKAYQMKTSKNIEVSHDTTKFLFSDMVIELFGIEPHEVTLLFANKIHYLTSFNKSYSGGSVILADFYNRLLYQHLLEWPDSDEFISEVAYEDAGEPNPEYPQVPYFKSSIHSQSIKTTLSKGWYGARIKASNGKFATDKQKLAHTELCSRLKEGASNEIQAFSANDIEISDKKKPTPWPEVADNCVQCHEGRNRVAVFIPFSDPKKIATLNKTYQSMFGSGNLYDSIETMINSEIMKPAHQGGRRMPLGRTPLNEKEKAELINWVQGQ